MISHKLFPLQSKEEIVTSMGQGPPPDLTKESLVKEEPDKVSDDFDGHLQPPDLLERTETRFGHNIELCLET